MTAAAKVKPYKIPSMRSVRALKWNGYNVASFFAGTGGSSTGYRMAGYKILMANEFVQAAADSYRANKAKYTHVEQLDIRKLSPEAVLKATGMKKGELDIIDGSPPCTAFSTAGIREKGWGKERKYYDTAQSHDDLFFEFSRIIKGVKPKVFVAENVTGLVKGKCKGYFLMILKELKDCGYRVEARVLDGSWMGLPQERRRVIFIGVRDDLELAPVFPKPWLYQISVETALKGLKDPDPSLCETHKPSSKTFKVWKHTRPGEYLNCGSKRLEGSIGFYQWQKIHMKRPCATICAQSALLLMPDKCRTLTIAEAKRLQGFPDDFILTGSFKEQWSRIGLSVPPLMMKEIAATIRDDILAKIPKKK